LVKIIAQPKKKEISPFSNRNITPKMVAKTLLRRNSKKEETKQQATLIRHKMANNIAGGFPLLKNEKKPTSSNDGTKANGNANAEDFFFDPFDSV
jgi:hypothetical protein